MDKWCIKDGYRINEVSNSDASLYIDTFECSRDFQTEVYKYARRIIIKYRLKTILDVGCGIGLKLKKTMFPFVSQHKINNKDIVGIDNSNSNIEICKSLGFGLWYIDDIENPKLNLRKKFDLIISADVIEHLFDPDKLLEYIKRHCHENTQIIISTPERGLLRGITHNGPPAGHHIREWNKNEFHKYIVSRDFVIHNHFLVDSKRLKGGRNIISKINLDYFLYQLRLIHARYKSCQVVLIKPVSP